METKPNIKSMDDFQDPPILQLLQSRIQKLEAVIFENNSKCNYF